MLYFVLGLILYFVLGLISYWGLFCISYLSWFCSSYFSWCCISQKGGAGNKGRVSETRHWPKRLHNKGWAFQNVWDSFCVTQILGAVWHKYYVQCDKITRCRMTQILGAGWSCLLFRGDAGRPPWLWTLQWRQGELKTFANQDLQIFIAFVNNHILKIYAGSGKEMKK